MNQTLKDNLEPLIRDLIINYLKNILLIDRLYESNEIQLSVEGKPSENGYDLDYTSLEIENFSLEAANGSQIASTIMWEMPYRIMRGQRDNQHRPGDKITGIISRMVLRVEFDVNTGEPRILSVDDFESSYRVRRG